MALLELAQPAIRIDILGLGATDLSVGASKLGGSPDFPSGATWPLYKGRPLALMAQFWMPDVTSRHIDGVLPATGMLYFFYDMTDQPWGYDPANRNAWKVIYYDVERAYLRRADLPQAALEEYPLPARELEFYPEFTLPPYNSDEVDELGLSDEDASNYWDVVNGETTHRLLGYPAVEQNDIRWEAQFASNGFNLGGGPIDMDDPGVRSLLPGVSDWRLLFQMGDDSDSEAPWFGGAGGRLFFSIRKQDLAQRNFGNVWVSFQWQ
jgi:uncharacterized protein YwqG